MRRRLLKITFRASVAILLVLLAAEVALRTIGFGNPVRFARDPSCSYLPAPNQHTRRFFAENNINAFGMRSGPITSHKAPGTFRAMFLGDSVTYGTTYLDQNRIFTTLLQRQLPGVLKRKVEVLNVSAGAWSVENELGYLRGHGTFESDIVVFVVNTTDTMQPMSILVEGDLNYPVNRPIFAVGEAFERYLWPRISARIDTQPDAGSQASANDNLANVPHVLTKIAEAKAFAHENGAGFALLYIPFRQSTFDDSVYKKSTAMLRGWCQETGTVLVDMTEEFGKYSPALTHLDGAHLRPEGHAIVAARLEREWAALLTAAAPPAEKAKAAFLISAE